MKVGQSRRRWRAGRWIDLGGVLWLACAVMCAAGCAASCAASCGGSRPGSESDAGDPEPPEITGIDGTGSTRPVSPRPEDQAAFDAAPGKVSAARRIDSADRELVITGSGLRGATRVRASGQQGQGDIEFEIQAGGTDTMLRVRFPQVLAVTAGGLFLLTLIGTWTRPSTAG